MTSLHTAAAEETRSLAAALAELARAGDLLLLVGEMGAGKTVFAQGFAAGLGVKDTVTSPTFTLLRHYEGRLPLHHLDVYRLDRMVEVHDLGLSEILDGPGVTLVEWGDVVEPALPADYLEVRLTFCSDDDLDARDVRLRTVGPSWAGRQAAVRRAVAQWTVEPGPGGGVPC